MSFLSERIEETEHDALEPRPWQAWGHGPRCIRCIYLRAESGESTESDYLMKTSDGRPLLQSSGA